jgi:hypothetical protein
MLAIDDERAPALRIAIVGVGARRARRRLTDDVLSLHYSP